MPSSVLNRVKLHRVETKVQQIITLYRLEGPRVNAMFPPGKIYFDDLSDMCAHTNKNSKTCTWVKLYALHHACSADVPVWYSTCTHDVSERQRGSNRWLGAEEKFSGVTCLKYGGQCDWKATLRASTHTPK